MVRRTIRAIRARYRRSWAGQDVQMTRGLLLTVSIASLSLYAVVPYLIQEDASADRRREERSQQIDEYRACEQAAEQGADIKATALEGVKHAESTAALMDSIADTLERYVGADEPPVAEIRREVNLYVDGVGEYRAVAETYTPTTLAECQRLPGAALIGQ